MNANSEISTLTALPCRHKILMYAKSTTLFLGLAICQLRSFRFPMKPTLGLPLYLTFLLALTTCKTRNWEDDGNVALGQEGVEVAEKWNFLCFEDQKQPPSEYSFTVIGLKASLLDVHDVTIDIAKKDGDEFVKMASLWPGQGQIAPGETFFLGFDSGALTGDSENGQEFLGLLTLENSDPAQGQEQEMLSVKVSCKASLL
jgi:hypothetical protein